MCKNLKGEKNHSLNEVCENTKHKQWDEIMNIVQDTKVEAESMKTSQTEIKLVIKIWKTKTSEESLSSTDQTLKTESEALKKDKKKRKQQPKKMLSIKIFRHKTYRKSEIPQKTQFTYNRKNRRNPDQKYRKHFHENHRRIIF